MLLALSLNNLDWKNWITSIIIITAFVGIAFASRFILERIVSLITRKSKTILDDLIVHAIQWPIFALLIVAGIWIGLSKVPELDPHQTIIHQLCSSAYILIFAVVFSRVTTAILVWYAKEIATRTETDIDDKLLPLLGRVITAIIYIFALIFILQVFNVQINTLLAGLGIGGLAVALALQPTLSNFLAGTYVMSDAVIHKGDYILLDSGHEGTVEEIGWRTTKLRSWQGNLIILPNSKMSDAIIIDYEKPETCMIFSVDCGVSYESDLEKVEIITLEVAAEVMNTCPCSGKDFTPVVRFKEFGDSNINFAVVLKSADRAGYFVVKHEFIKALHNRFKREYIDIQYPVRKILFAAGNGKLTRI
jgi:small-conductance mechanosensitive channel